MSFIMAFIGSAIGIILGIFIYAEVESGLNCPNGTLHPDDAKSCERAKQTSWAVIGILPISLFFGLFTLFGGWKTAF